MKILYVEDSVDFRRCILQYLPELLPADTEFFVAENGKEALDLFSGLKPDLVLTDYRMPLMTGEEMAQSLRNDGVIVPIILMSGTPEDCQNTTLFNDILEKSTSLKEIANRIINVVKKAA